MGQMLKKLGVSLVAVLALSLVITSISAAAQFTSSSYPAFYEAEGNPEKFGTVTIENGLSVKCSSGLASATLSGASSTLSVSGVPGGCTAFGFASATVSNNGCTTLVHVSKGSGDTWTGTGDLVCPAGKAVTTVASSCEMQVPAQEGSVDLEFTNKTAEGTVQVDVKTSHFRYIKTKDGFLCPFNGTGEKTDGTGTQIKAGLVKIEGKKLSVN